jgi:hypothetical protein
MHFRNTDRDGRLGLIDYQHDFVTPYLTKTQIKLIENSKAINPFIKAQILQLTTGTRTTTEVWTDELELAKSKHFLVSKEVVLKEIEMLLDKLPFVCSRVSTFRKTHAASDGKAFEKMVLIQVSISEYVDKYIQNYWQTFSSYEHGVLYGYPTSSISAFLYLTKRYPTDVKKRDKYTVAMEAIGPGIYSEQFFKEEKSYYDRIWKQLKKISPDIVRQCEKEYIRFHKSLSLTN